MVWCEHLNKKLITKLILQRMPAKLSSWIDLECLGNNRDAIVQQIREVSKTDTRERRAIECVIYSSRVISIHQLQQNIVMAEMTKKETHQP